MTILAAPLAAQQRGSVEVGGFGQYTRADGAWNVKSGPGVMGRLGVFVTPRVSLEADASFSNFTNAAPRPSGKTEQQTFAGRAVYNLPFGLGGRTHHLLAELGAGVQR